MTEDVSPVSLDEQPASVTADMTAAAPATAATPAAADEENLGVTVEKKLTSEVTETVTVTGMCAHQLA